MNFKVSCGFNHGPNLGPFWVKIVVNLWICSFSEEEILGQSPENLVKIHKWAPPGTIQPRAVQPTLSECPDL